MLKKSLLFLVFLLGIKLSSMAQSTPSLNYLEVYSDSCYTGANGYTILVNGNISNFAPGYNVKIFWGDGNNTSITPSQGYYYSQHNYSSPGTYTVSSVLFNGTTPVDTLFESVDGFCTIVKGFAYKRYDANCTKSTTEPILNSPFDIEVRKAGVPVDTIHSNGYFYKKINGADFTSVFSLHMITAPSGMLLACPTAAHTFKFDTLNYYNFDGFAFAFDCDPANSDFDMSVLGSGFFRPVANSYIYLYPQNSSCLPQNGIVTLQLSPKYSFVSSNIPTASVSGNTITWNMNNLSNTNWDNIYVTLNAVGTLTIGDTVMNHVSITPTAGDINPTNNTIVMIDSIRASYDPNEKHSSPIGDIDQGELITYTIHFENLGNDTAFNIHIMDTLSSFLVAESFKLITSSHPVSYQMLGSAAQKVLRFDFANILLADASAPNENKGFVTYQINAKTGLALGTSIDNTAHIYFDINPAIVTNTTRNKIPNELSIRKTNGLKPIAVYPNPANDKLFVENFATYSQWSIVNIMGHKMALNPTKNNSSYIAIDHLPAGIYFLKAIGKDGMYAQKFVKN